MTDLTEQIYHLLEDGHPLILATVIRHSGSTPRGAGAKMIVLKDGGIIGTIGGGSVEAEVIKSAPELFRSGGAVLRRFNFSSTDAASSMGMICGGDMDVLLEKMDPDNAETIDVFRQLALRLRTGEKSLIVKLLPSHEVQIESYRFFLITDTAADAGDLLLKDFPLNANTFENLKEAAFKQRIPATEISGDHMIVADPFFSSDRVYLFGAGHVSQKLAVLLHMVGFRTVVIDDRSEFANRDLFPAIDDIFVPEGFATAFSNLSIARRDALVILTRGHAHDQTVLEQALKTDSGYIGMIGSSKKRDTIYDNLQKKGVTRDTLGRVHCPIGIDIGARTPEEIAVCIAAQLIAYRAGRV